MTSTFDRRGFLRTALTTTIAGVAGCARIARSSETQGTRSVTVPESIALEPLATGLRVPLDVVFDPAADLRLVAERRGLVHVHETGGLRDEPFLDLRDAVEAQGEKGLLGVELHPDYEENRRVFVRYSAPSRPGTPEDYDHTFVLSEFEATADGGRVDRDSERTLLDIPQPWANHNAGDLAFGPDDYLYVGVGDGGRGADQGRGHVADWYDVNGGGNGQDVTENLHGSILRIDVDSGQEDAPYAIPDDNPLVGTDGFDEHYAWGFRNPWRMSFDGDDLFVGDVGERLHEEVNLVVKGGNYGWNVKEGSQCFNANDTDEPLDECPDSTPERVRGGEPLIDPIVEYSGTSGPTAVICGNVYRGSALPSLNDVFVFGDLSPRSSLFAATRPESDGQWPTQMLDLDDEGADSLQQLFSIGRGPGGELYVLGSGSEDGGLFRLVPAG